jgi:PilZ domain
VSVPTRQALVMANAMDISLDGICVISAEPLFQGEDALLTFQITSRSGVQVEAVWGRVIHVRMDDDAWVVGLKFNQVLDQRQTPLLARAAANPDTQP